MSVVRRPNVAMSPQVQAAWTCALCCEKIGGADSVATASCGHRMHTACFANTVKSSDDVHCGSCDELLFTAKRSGSDDKNKNKNKKGKYYTSQVDSDYDSDDSGVGSDYDSDGSDIDADAEEISEAEREKVRLMAEQARLDELFAPVNDPNNKINRLLATNNNLDFLISRQLCATFTDLVQMGLKPAHMTMEKDGERVIKMTDLAKFKGFSGAKLYSAFGLQMGDLLALDLSPDEARALGVNVKFEDEEDGGGGGGDAAAGQKKTVDAPQKKWHAAPVARTAVAPDVHDKESKDIAGHYSTAQAYSTKALNRREFSIATKVTAPPSDNDDDSDDSGVGSDYDSDVDDDDDAAEEEKVYGYTGAHENSYSASDDEDDDDDDDDDYEEDFRPKRTEAPIIGSITVLRAASSAVPSSVKGRGRRVVGDPDSRARQAYNSAAQSVPQRLESGQISASSNTWKNKFSVGVKL